MKFILSLFLTLCISTMTLFAQSSDREKIENQKYYQSFIKDNINYMREYVDSTNIKLMLISMEQINDKIGSELEKIPMAPDPEENADSPNEDTGDDVMTEDIETAEEDVTLNGEGEMSDEKIEDLFKMPEGDEDSTSPLDKFLPGRKNKDKINKTSFIVNFGINMLGSPEGLGIRPTAKVGSSWFWEYGLQNRIRLGASKKAYFLIGLSYLKNRFTWENDVQLLNLISTGPNKNIPQFSLVENLKGSPKMRVGYVTLPLGLRFKLAKKTYIDVGGYVGYNVLTSQTHVFKLDDEKITEKRNGDYGVNDWTYGATAALKFVSTRFVFKYNLSPLFVENTNFNTNLVMIGLQSEL